MSRRISWIRAAQRDFLAFPEEVQLRMTRALEIAAAGEMADLAKPMSGFGPGVFEIAVSYRRDAYRSVYAVRIGVDLWVVHAFQKKSTQGIKTPRHEIEVIRERLKRLKEMET